MSKTNKSYKPGVNKARIAVKISDYVENGRQEILGPNIKKEIEKFPIGSLISYTNKLGEFRQGGFIVKFGDEYFIYLMPDFETKYRVKYKNVDKLWVGDVHKTKNDIVSIVKTSQKKTRFPVKFDDVLIYYAVDSYDVKRYKKTKKYENMTKWYDYFKKNE
ncbi:hypothetical protein QLL95_gp0338 [Cotonvirus japonicus]|uniref:Uncharacterized protein n=2 Tax=Cotonvirus japonicus TaxID=2811091 RepID=A0ABM7NUD1_9VIRU|nr:hypothetical protein QLL95_gp0338 [Cotonvirus japonicus]BCS83785.1 hypothetical protein [Cotonvirus japonicus]